MADELDFDAKEFAAMTTKQRIRICKLLAERAREIAELAHAEHREAYLRIAAEWEKLARDIAQED
jgi:hypothetical protein